METPQEYIESLLFTPRIFFENIVDYHKIKHFNIIFGIYCIGYGIDRLEKQFLRRDLKGELEQIEFLNNWPVFWLMVSIGGLIGGYIAYLIGGWFYNVRIKWSNGVGDIDKSRGIYVLSSLFIYSFAIIYTLFQTVLFDIPYESESDFEFFDAIGFFLTYAFIFHGIYISYHGALTFTNIEIGKAKIWFLYIPGIMYIAALVFLVLGVSSL